MDESPAEFRLDKTAFTIAFLSDETDEKIYWQNRSHHERLQAIELMRQIIYGYDPATTRLQRILTITELV